jgi:hypothetical protein
MLEDIDGREQNIFRFMQPDIPCEMAIHYSEEYKDVCKAFDEGKKSELNLERCEMLEELALRSGRIIYDRRFYKY